MIPSEKFKIIKIVGSRGRYSGKILGFELYNKEKIKN